MKYGVPSESGEQAIKLVARTEGILLAPVYTGKAFAGMLDLIEKGQLGANEPIIFYTQAGYRRCSLFESYYDQDVKMQNP